MSCMLRIGGRDLDIEALLQVAELPIDSHWKKGQRRFPTSETNVQVNDSSGFRVVVSEADFSDIAAQMDDALQFFASHRAQIENVVGYPGVEWATLDFGADLRPPFWASFCFPSALAAAVGATGVSLELSVYPSDDSDDEE